MSGTHPTESSNPERPYGREPIVLLLFFIVSWKLLSTVQGIPAVADLYATIEEAAREVEPALDPEFSSFLASARLLATFGVIYTAAWFAIIALQYTFAYGLWKPKRWARKLGFTSLGLGLTMDIAKLLTSFSVSEALQLDTTQLVRWDIAEVALDAIVFSAALWFLNKPKVRDYTKAEGYGYAEPTPPAIEEEIEPGPLEEAQVEPAAPADRVEPEETLHRIARIPDTIRGKRPESVAWIAEDKCIEEIFLDGDHLIIVKSPDEPVIDIPIKDIVKLEQGEMSRYDSRALDVLRGMGISIYDTTKISELKITYSTKPGLTSTVTLVMERKICPKCGERMSLVAAGWYCMKGDHLLDPTTQSLVQKIESRRPQKTSKQEVD